MTDWADGARREYLPSAPVVVPVLLFFTRTLTPSMGCPFDLSVTVPDTSTPCAEATIDETEKTAISISRRKRR